MNIIDILRAAIGNTFRSKLRTALTCLFLAAVPQAGAPRALSLPERLIGAIANIVVVSAEHRDAELGRLHPRAHSAGTLRTPPERSAARTG